MKLGFCVSSQTVKFCFCAQSWCTLEVCVCCAWLWAEQARILSRSTNTFPRYPAAEGLHKLLYIWRRMSSKDTSLDNSLHVKRWLLQRLSLLFTAFLLDGWRINVGGRDFCFGSHYFVLCRHFPVNRAAIFTRQDHTLDCNLPSVLNATETCHRWAFTDFPLFGLQISLFARSPLAAPPPIAIVCKVSSVLCCLCQRKSAYFNTTPRLSQPSPIPLALHKVLMSLSICIALQRLG